MPAAKSVFPGNQPGTKSGDCTVFLQPLLYTGIVVSKHTYVCLLDSK